MSKAMLILDKPKRCEDCILLNDRCICVATGYNTIGMEADLCPLIDMPSKIDAQRQNEIDISNGDFLADKICESIGKERQGNSTDIYLGWNACLKEIIGEEDEQN